MKYLGVYTSYDYTRNYNVSVQTMKYLGVYTGFRVPARNDKMSCCLNEDGILSGIG